MALTHLVDTSVLTRLGRPGVRAVVEPLALAGRLARVTVSDLEIGCYSAGSAAEWDGLVASLDAFVRVDTTADHLRRAMQVQRLLASRHQRGRKIPDLLVAAAAEELDVAVLHYDADFDLIARGTGQPCQRVVAPRLDRLNRPASGRAGLMGRLAMPGRSPPGRGCRVDAVRLCDQPSTGIGPAGGTAASAPGRGAGHGATPPAR